MAIGTSTSSPILSNLTSGLGGADRNPTETPGGLRGLASLGTGLRTGLTVVQRATVTASELGEARARASEALAEQARLERENAAAQDAAREAELQADQSADPTADTESALVQRTVDAAVTAGESGDVAPRGAFVDLSV